MPKRSTNFIRNIRQLSSFTSTPVKAIVALLISGFLAGVAYEEFIGMGTWHSYSPETDKINVCFTPPSGCGALIIEQISKAQNTIHMQAFNFYSSKIANELIDAKKRGVEVSVILDKTNLNNPRSQMENLVKAGIEVVIDKAVAIAHNKIIILDGARVLTGSFNFSESADTKNAENVLLIDDKKIARGYLQNWMRRYSSSKPLR